MRITELLNEFMKVNTLQLDSVSSHYYAAYGPESPVWMAAITGCCSITFLVIIIPSEKHSKLSKEKTPSWIVDLILIAAFVLALSCSTLIAIVLRITSIYIFRVLRFVNAMKLF
ncbi:hypothetical protein TSUD_331070 [Trifolium subterraneum]|uniref:Uncharacterized protein n=1 Tax=Trifolium subterraneum TaxID=3900 RepID=A0A2Z6MJ80_TRISU|nr:hypothetical protein TSUD_331070 [Trifolium subterraneum]